MFENFGEKMNAEEPEKVKPLERGKAYALEKDNRYVEAIGSVRNFKELFETIKEFGEIKGSREKPYDYFELRRDINEAYGAFFLDPSVAEAGSFADPLSIITSGVGLRKKVRELLEAEKVRRST